MPRTPTQSVELLNVADTSIVTHAVQAAAVEDERESRAYSRRAQPGGIGPREINRGIPGAATDIERGTRGRRRRALDQVPQGRRPRLAIPGGEADSKSS